MEGDEGKKRKEEGGGEWDRGGEERLEERGVTVWMGGVKLG